MEITTASPQRVASRAGGASLTDRPPASTCTGSFARRRGEWYGERDDERHGGRGGASPAGAASAPEGQRVRTGEPNGALSVQFRHTFVTSCAQAVRSFGLPSPGWWVGGGLLLRLLGSSAASGPTRAGCPSPLRGPPGQQLLPRRGNAHVDGTPAELPTEMQAGAARPSWAERLGVTRGAQPTARSPHEPAATSAAAGRRAPVRAAPQRDQGSSARPGEHQRTQRQDVRGRLAARCIDRDARERSDREPAAIGRPCVGTSIEAHIHPPELDIEDLGQKPGPAERHTRSVRAELDATRSQRRREPAHRVPAGPASSHPRSA